MAGIFFDQPSRRQFVVRTLGTIGVAVAGSANVLALGESGNRDVFHLSLLSDTHFPADPENKYRGFKPAENLRKVVPHLIAAKSSGVIINGDAARLEGFKKDYVALKKELAPVAAVAPIYFGMGNHDHRANFESVFASKKDKRAVSGKHVLVIESPQVNVVVLDSLLYVNKVAGLLGKAQRTWLKKYLASNGDKPCVFFIHHTLGDGDGDLLDADRLFQLIKPYAHVKAIFYGHSHRYSFDQRDGVHLINLPAVGYNFNDNEPVGWVDAKFGKASVDLTLHAIGGNVEGDGKTVSKFWKPGT